MQYSHTYRTHSYYVWCGLLKAYYFYTMYAKMYSRARVAFSLVCELCVMWEIESLKWYRWGIDDDDDDGDDNNNETIKQRQWFVYYEYTICLYWTLIIFYAKQSGWVNNYPNEKEHCFIQNCTCVCVWVRERACALVWPEKICLFAWVPHYKLCCPPFDRWRSGQIR